MKQFYLTLIAVLVCFSSFGIGPITGGNYMAGRNWTTNLADSTPGGVWSSSDTSIVTINASGVAKGVAAGAATISYTVGAASATLIVTVDRYASYYKMHWADTTFNGWACADDTRFHILFDGSDNGVIYTLYNSTCRINTMDTFVGTGGPMDLGRPKGSNCNTMGSTILLSAINSYGLNRLRGTDLFYRPGDTAITITGPNTMCSGTSITLRDTNYVYWDGHWSSSNPSLATVTAPVDSTHGVVTGISPGTAIITFTLTNDGALFCVSSRTKVVTVHAAGCTGMPAAGTVTGSSIICPGTNTTLTLTAYTTCTQLQWQSSADSITWVDIPGAGYDTLVIDSTASAWYRCKSTCLTSGLSAFTPAFPIYRGFSIAAHAIIHNADTVCNLAHFRLSACGISHDPLNVTTWFGDGSSLNTSLTGTLNANADIYHQYLTPGTYTVKHVLYNGTIPQDSVVFPYEFVFCNYLPLKFYYDANHNCVFDSVFDNPNMVPLRVVIDSDSHTIDTISALSGLFYKALGPIGTIYSFRPILYSPDMAISCPSSGIINDTIGTITDGYPVNYFGINCSADTLFDLGEHITFIAYRHTSRGFIYVTNPHCIPENATVKCIFSPKLTYSYSTPAPTSVVGQTIIWDLTNIKNTHIRYIGFELPQTTSLMPGDTIHTSYKVTPITGDIDTSNNYIERIDTVLSAYDPNEMEVSPAGNILPCTNLQYTIRFENTGNAPAQNIYILDTLPANVNMHTLKIVAASAAMNVVYINDGGYNIVKFDFPNINLPDSSHHNECDGMVVFTIKVLAGLANGTKINNRAGIYFDDNAVVMTNEVVNTIGMNPIIGPFSLCLGSNPVYTNLTTSGVWSLGDTSSATINTTGALKTKGVGSTSIFYTVTLPGCAAVHATKSLTINQLPAAFRLSGGMKCINDINGHIILDSSVAADFYQLWNNGNPVFTTISGTGHKLDFGAITTPGNYSAFATDYITQCRNIMINTVSNSAYSLPIVYNMSGGGTNLNGKKILPIGLDGSDTGVVYELFYKDSAIMQLNGTGGALDFGQFGYSGDYTITGTNISTSCATLMAGSANIVKDPTVHISPNPAHSQLTLEMDKDAYTTYTISNEIGQVLATEPLGAGTNIINIRHLASGIYFITFRGIKGTKVMKFVKE